MKIRVLQIICYVTLLFMDSAFIAVLDLHFAQMKTQGALKADFNRISRSFTTRQSRLLKLAMFFVFTIGRLLSGYVSLIVNNKHLLLITVTLEVVISVFAKTVTVYMGFYGFFTFLSILVLCQALHYSPIINMTAKWIPPHEYSRAIAAINVGSSWPGTLLSPNLWSEPLISIDNVFKAIAIVKSLWIVLFLLVGSQEPRLSWLIRKREMAVLSKAIGPTKKIRCGACVPWKGIFRMPILYGMITSNIAYRFINNTTGQFHYLFPNVDQTGCSIAMIFQPFALFACAWFTDVLIFKFSCPRNDVRKVWNSISMWGAAASLAWICFFYKEPNLIPIFFTLARYSGEMVSLGYSAAAMEISPNYASIIGAIISFPGWMSIILKTSLDDRTKSFLEHGHAAKAHNISTVEGKLPILYRTASVLFVMNYGFLMCGKVELRDFDSYDTVDWRKTSEVSYL
ncbi:solute carrier family 17 [Nesidiocoris tenuis]|uniref:Solute carrier family 17 n=1 Tax=Nesidiocoris tenuis TaxID=355587 RepID=A0ABN7BCV7_9HEMI|nr:solute carrier family 17 [Nesidiocoris tenuis]